MGLLTILKKQRAKEREMRLLVLGLDNAGKTTLVKQLLHEDVSTVSPTVGFKIESVAHRGYTLNIWDVGGQRSIRSFWRNYFEQTDGIVWVVDAADPVRLRDCRRELHALLQEERLAGASLLVLANKQDVPGALSLDAVREALALEDIRSHRWAVRPCSARTGANVVAGLDWIVDDVAARIYVLS